MHQLEKIRRHVFGVPCPSVTSSTTPLRRFKPIALASAGTQCTGRMCGSVPGMGAGQQPYHEPREALMDLSSPATRSHSAIEENIFLRLEVPEKLPRDN